MLTNLERKAQIDSLRKKLEADLANLQQKFREETASLEKTCRQHVAVIEHDIQKHATQELREAREQVQQILRNSGIDPTIILAGLPGARGKAAPRERRQMRPSTVLHHGPDGKVWNGRGRVPGWYKNAAKAAQMPGPVHSVVH